MKILHIGKFYPIQGGVEKVMFDICEGISSIGIDCDMLCASMNSKSQIIEINEHFHVITTKTIKKAFSTMLSPNMIFRLRQIKNGYDIIHIHHPDPMACLALFFSGYKGIVILHWHSDILKQKTLLKFYAPLQKWLVNRANKIITTTPIYGSFSNAISNYSNKIVSIPIGIDEFVNIPQKTLTNIKENYKTKKIIFSLGRLIEYKGFQYLVDAMKYLSENYICLIGGDGPLKEDLQNQIRTNNLESKVKLLGRISDDDLPAYYQACDLYCLSSIYKTEAFAIVQIEAMSCGKPIVATNIQGSGVPWVNAHNVSGINVEPMNSKALATGIEYILNDNDRYKQFSINSRKRFESLFTKKEMIFRVQKLYESVLRK
jgi:rhamnosyl/mannosyltransferase